MTYITYDIRSINMSPMDHRTQIFYIYTKIETQKDFYS